MKNVLLSLQGPSRLQARVEKRATILALSRGGISCATIALLTIAHPRTVTRWVGRGGGGAPLTDLPRCGRPRRFQESARLMTIAVYCQQSPPLPGVHIWSLRDAEKHFKENPQSVGGPISRATIHRILLEHALRPHRHEYFLQITDPNFFPKMEHIIGCYSNPPENLYCFDECTCIQALKRLTPDLPADQKRPLLQDFDYLRNGTTDLLAFLNTATGKVYGRLTDNHDTLTLCEVFTSHVQTHPDDAVIHYIMDNLSPHYHDDFCKTVAILSDVTYKPLKTGHERRQWLQSEDKRIVVHFVPFHASWLNMVEIWFGILKSKCLNYGHFSSVEYLRKDITEFIATWNEFYAHPFNWSYTGEGLHAKAVQRFCRLLTIQTDQMDCKFLTSQLLLMSNIAEHYLELIPVKNWLQLLDLATQNDSYINRIIETETGPQRQAKARKAYSRFVQIIENPKQVLRKAA